MYRGLVIGIFVAVVALILWSVTVRATDVTVAEVLAGIATEAIGIIVTVGVVDYLLERDRRNEGIRNMAWDAIHRLDHAIWVWQGGSRRFNADELIAMIRQIGPDDPMPFFTQNLFLQLGGVSQASLDTRRKFLKGSKSFREAAELLSRLCRLRDSSSPMAPIAVRDCIEPAATRLLRIVGHDVGEVDESLFAASRNPSEQAQRWRHFGEPPDEPGRGGARL